MNEYILTLLKADLGELFIDDERRAYLNQAIMSAKDMIRKEGIILNDSPGDDQIVEMYAAYLVRKRATNDGMPRMLRYAMNNRLFKQKAVQTNDA